MYIHFFVRYEFKYNLNDDKIRRKIIFTAFTEREILKQQTNQKYYVII